MIDVAKFPNAYKEVYTILKYVDEEDVNKIPKNYMNMIKSKMNKDYEFKYDENVDFENQKILRETKAIFAYIYLNFWGNDKEVSVIKQKFKQDVNEAEKVKSEKYKFDWNKINKEKAERENAKLENTKEAEQQQKENFENPNTQLVEYKEDKWYKKIFSFIKKIFKK